MQSVVLIEPQSTLVEEDSRSLAPRRKGYRVSENRSPRLRFLSRKDITTSCRIRTDPRIHCHNVEEQAAPFRTSFEECIQSSQSLLNVAFQISHRRSRPGSHPVVIKQRPRPNWRDTCGTGRILWFSTKPGSR